MGRLSYQELSLDDPNEENADYLKIAASPIDTSTPKKIEKTVSCQTISVGCQEEKQYMEKDCQTEALVYSISSQTESLVTSQDHKPDLTKKLTWIPSKRK